MRKKRSTLGRSAWGKGLSLQEFRDRSLRLREDMLAGLERGAQKLNQEKGGNMRVATITDEVFTWEGVDGKKGFTINVTSLWDAVTSGEVAADRVVVPIDPEFVEFVHKHRGIEQGKLDRLDHRHMTLPVLLVQNGPTPYEVLMVDGHHRYVKMFQLGWQEIRAAIVFGSVWRRFIICDGGPG